MPCNDCSRTETCPPCPEEEECRCGPGEKCGVCFESKEPMDSEHSSSKYHRCTCGHVKHVHSKVVGSCNSVPCRCQGFVCDHTRCGWEPREEPEEPPLTPEEEEMVPGYEELARESKGMQDPDAPPQPERRPPYAVAYSVQGHLYEVALSGDATVRAVDGALVIQHHLGPVAGIVQVLPVINKESDA